MLTLYHILCGERATLIGNMYKCMECGATTRGTPNDNKVKKFIEWNR